MLIFYFFLSNKKILYIFSILFRLLILNLLLFFGIERSVVRVSVYWLSRATFLDYDNYRKKNHGDKRQHGGQRGCEELGVHLHSLSFSLF